MDETDALGTILEAPEGPGDGFLYRFGTATRAVCEELGLGAPGDIDVFFLGFLRTMARFGVFSFGPITIYVPLIQEIVARTALPSDEADEHTSRGIVRLSRALWAEVERSGGRRLDELHVLLAFMRINEGLPRRVFAELGVTPEHVEEFARTGRMGEPDLERLFSPEEAAEYLGIHVQTVRTWIRSGRLKAHRLAGQRALRIKASDLAGVLEPVDADEV